MNIREKLRDKQRIIIKIGSSSLTHETTGALNLTKLEILVREISNIHNMGKEVILVSSGAIAVGSSTAGFHKKPTDIAEKQACAAIGQAKLMMIYQKLFAEYGQMAAQILLTKFTITNSVSRDNAYNTFQELLKLGAIPIVNENDTVSTDEIKFGDNDNLSAMVASLIGADLLILLSDIDGLFTDDPHQNPSAEFIDTVEELDEKLFHMGKSSSGSNVGTGGMSAKLSAAQIAVSSGADMIIANGKDFHIIHKILNGEQYGTLFVAKQEQGFSLADYLHKIDIS
ncbi:MAG: glutamate 5-kinase [Eubacteriales bacterium]|nr:glutamate 5-kinase [Eubacteriales bacterium]